MDRVAFSIFGKDIYWYGVIIMLGMVAAFTHAYIRCKQEKISTDDLLDVGIWTVLCGVLGARLYYVLTTLGDGEYHSIVDVIAIWNGGLAIYGGIIAGALTIAVVTRIKRMNTVQLMDTVAPGVMIAQAMGRWANFVNGEAFGREIAEGSLLYPFRMGLISDFTDSVMKYYHPTFLYGDEVLPPYLPLRVHVESRGLHPDHHLLPQEAFPRRDHPVLPDVVRVWADVH